MQFWDFIGSVMVDYEREKQLAAAKSIELIQDGMNIGLGSGSTIAYAVELLGEQVKAGLRIQGIPTSEQTRALSQRVGLPLTSFEHVTRLDLTIDGADQVDPQLRLIKGGGGALLHEKVVASASDRVVIIVDSSKWFTALGCFTLPVEVISFAVPVVKGRIRELGGYPSLRLNKQGGQFVTDEGNYILDSAFSSVESPEALSDQLDRIPGIVEHGIFIGLAHCLLIGKGEAVEVIQRHRGESF